MLGFGKVAARCALFGAIGLVAAAAQGRPIIDETPAVIDGRVLRDSDGQPLAGATVRCVRLAGPIMGCATGWMTERACRIDLVTTDADGRFRLEFPGGLGLHDIQVMPTRVTGMAHVSWLPLPGGSAGWLQPGDHVDAEVFAPARHELRGRVVDETGTGFAGAEVKVWHYGRLLGPDHQYLPPDLVVVAERDGRFEILSTGPWATLEAGAPDRIPLDRLVVTTSPGACVDGLELTLGTACFVEGQVMQADGTPLAAASVYVSRGDPHDHGQATDVPGAQRFTRLALATRTDADGRFRLGPVPRAELDVSVSLEPFLPWTRRLVPDQEALRIVLDGGVALTGTVRGAEGQLLSGAEVRTLAFGGASQRTGADGAFRFVGVPPSGAAMVVVTAPGHASLVIPDLRIEPGRENRLDVRLERGFTIEGCVVDGDGRPFAGQTIYARGDRSVPGQPERSALWVRQGHEWASPEELAGQSACSTDAHGRFRFDGLYPGRFHLLIGYPPQGFFAESGGDPVSITLARPEDWRRRLLGKVVDARTGEPVRDYTVTPLYMSGSPRSQDRLAQDGASFTLDLGSGATRVIVAAPGYVEWSTMYGGDDARDYEEDIALVRGRRLVVRVVDEAGKPVLKRPLSFWCRDELVAFDLDGRRTDGRVDSGRKGAFVAERLPPGVITVKSPRPHVEPGGKPEYVWDIDLTRDDAPDAVDLLVSDER